MKDLDAVQTRIRILRLIPGTAEGLQDTLKIWYQGIE